MTYTQAREFINNANQYGSRLGLEAITELLKRLDNPQDRLKVIHVAGTNGKGSTTTFLASILAEQGYLVGRFISPTVFDYLECVQFSKRVEQASLLSESMISNEYLSEHGFVKAVEMIQPICEAMNKEGLPHPTSFEIETAMALLSMVWEKVDFAIFEVGLGGRLDATNVFTNPLCNVLTSISMDHMQYLGDSISRIAYEKAGIIKKGARVITCNTVPEILDSIQDICEQLNNHLTIADIDEVKEIVYTREKTGFLYEGYEYEITLLGNHQIKNAILAITTAKQLVELGYPISDRAIQSGLRNTVWGGRFEILARNPYFVIDGAHNEEAALQLQESLLHYFRNQRKIFILGVLADKEYTKILKITAGLADIILTITPGNNRALASSLLAEEAKLYTTGKVVDADSISKAVKLAYEYASDDDLILAFGSLSYLGELRSYLNK
jgi:folylpolyglutamate synthase/dihydrofolate synthase